MEFFRTPTMLVIQELIRGNVDDEGVSAERMIWRVKSQPALIVFNGGDELLALQTCFLAYARERRPNARLQDLSENEGITRVAGPTTAASTTRTNKESAKLSGGD